MSTENPIAFSPAPVEGATPPKVMPTSLEELGKLTITIASAKHTIGKDEERESEEVVEQETKMMARARMTSEKEDRENGLLKTGVANWWKYGVHSLGTYIKEKDQAQRIMAESGMQMKSLPYEFVRQVRQSAQEAVDKDRTGEDDRETNKLQRKGRRRDFFNAARLHQKDLDRKEVEIMQSLRQSVTLPAGLSPEDRDIARQFAIDNGTLVESYKKVLSGDFQASEGLAERLGNEFGDDAIRTAVGEARAENIEMKGPMAAFFKDEVIKPLLKRGMANNGELDDDTLLEKRTLIQEKFFTKDFVEWHKDLPEEARNALDLSMSYGTNVIPAVQDMLKNLKQIQDTLSTNVNIEDVVNNLVLNVNVGTLKAGEQGGVNESWKEDRLARSIKNKEVYNLYQSIEKDKGPDSAVPGAYKMALDSASRRVLRLPGGHVTAGLLTGVAIYAAQSTTRMAGNLVAPIVGGSFVGGLVRAGQEHSRFTREVEQHRREAARGVTFDEDDKRREKMQELELPTVDIQTEVLAPLKEVKRKFEEGNVDKGVLDETLELLANTRASRRIMDDDQSIELYQTTSNNSLDAQKTKLELLRAQIRVQLNAYAEAHHEDTITYLKELGIDGEEYDTPFMRAEELLSDALIANLSKGSDIDESFEAILGDIAVDKGDSIDARERAMSRARAGAMAKQGLFTFGAGAIGGVLSHYASGAIISGGKWVSDKASNFPPVQKVYSRLFDWQNPGGKVEVQKGFHPKGTIASKINGKTVTIPEGTTWHPNGNNTYDLVIVGHPDQVLANDVTFKGDKLVYDQNGSLINPNDVSDRQIKYADRKWVKPSRTTERKTFDGEKFWDKLRTHINHREWYSNDTAQSDQNELRFHTLKRGNAVLLQMQGTGMSHDSNLAPSKLDVQEMIQKGKAQFAFNLPGETNEPVVVNANAVTKDSDGRWLATLKLDPTDTNPDHRVTFGNGKKMQLGEFSKMVIDQKVASRLPDGDFASEVHTQYRDVFRLGGGDGDGRGQISAGRLIKHDGKDVWQSIATINGTGEGVDKVTTEVTTKIPGRYESFTNNQTLYEIKADIPDKTIVKPGDENGNIISFGSNPFKHKPWVGPDIAFPLVAPRTPLEAGNDSEGPRTEPISLIRTSPPEADQSLDIAKTYAVLENELLQDSRYTTKDVTSGTVKIKDDVRNEIRDYVQDAADRRMSQDEVVEQFKSFYAHLKTTDSKTMTPENENINVVDQALIADFIRKNVNGHYGRLPNEKVETVVQKITSFINEQRPNLLSEPNHEDKILDLVRIYSILAPDMEEEDDDLAKTRA